MNTNRQATAPVIVKTFAPQGLQFLDLGALRGYMEAKDYDLDVVSKFAERGVFAPLFADLVLRTGGLDNELLNQFGQALQHVPPTKLESYTGSDTQNSRIDSAIANSGIARDVKRYGEGSASFFETKSVIPTSIRNVPIAIVGYGAAGIIAGYALSKLGFQRITVYEKGKNLGIWSYKNVFELSRNNPLRLQFFNSVLDPAPGGGIEVRDFLSRLAILNTVDARVVKIQPGKMKHKLVFSDKSTAEYPIVVNAVGLGKPRPVSDPARMVTETGQAHAGARWQQQLRVEDVAGQQIVLIGLGNSTAEMLQQIHTLIDDGYYVDYRVLTHYPEEAVYNPSTYVEEDGRTFRVFRDTSKPNLVDYQGDLARSRYDYFRALHEGKIISGVKRWEVKTPGVMAIYGKNRKNLGKLPFDKVMTLIGYHQGKDEMQNLGCSYDEKQGSGVFDYDGEVAGMPGNSDPKKRLHKGYFGFGSILETPLNPNAIVIPGMLHRIGDLAFSVIMRAAEFRNKDL
ncbi:MAG: NAD(P)-binding protein [Patescibacteria group bacterium]